MWPKPRGLVHLVYVIKSPQSRMILPADHVLRAVINARLSATLFPPGVIYFYAVPLLGKWYTRGVIQVTVFPIFSFPFNTGACWRRILAPPILHRRLEQAVRSFLLIKQPFPVTGMFFLELLWVLSPYYPFGENTYPAFERPDRTTWVCLTMDYDQLFSTLRNMDYDQLFEVVSSGGPARDRFVLVGGKKDLRFARLIFGKEKETESAEVLRLRDQVSVLAADKSFLSAEVSALKSVVSQKDTDISLLDSRASYLKSALDDSQAAVSTLHSAFRDFKEKMEAFAGSACPALEEADFPLVHLLKSKKYSGMDEVLDCFLLDGPLADLPEAAHLQPCLKQLSVPIYHADVNAVVGETSLSLLLKSFHTRAEGARIIPRSFVINGIYSYSSFVLSELTG
ncbi:hypothetical protein Tco_0031657 [Tanacetum coccineum]